MRHDALTFKSEDILPIEQVQRDKLKYGKYYNRRKDKHVR